MDGTDLHTNRPSHGGYVWAIVLQTSQENIQDLKWDIM